MSTANLDAADLAAVDFNGLITEDVMAEIWDISDIPLELSDRIGSSPTHNAYAEWTTDVLGAVDVDNATVDGADAAGNDTAVGARVGNQHQIPDKTVKVSTRARNSGTIGFSDTLAYQLMMRQRELLRDKEAITMQGQASVADDGDSVAGRLGGLPSWLTTNTSRGTGGADGGFSAGTVDAPTAGEARALTETLVRDMAESAWLQGANPSGLMSVPQVIRKLSEYMFSSSARIATLNRNEQGMGSATAVGTVTVFLTDYGVTLEFVPNRLQQTYLSTDGTPKPVANVFILDWEYLEHGVMQGVQVAELAKTGTADNRQMTTDITLKVLTETAHAVIADVDPTVAVTQ